MTGSGQPWEFFTSVDRVLAIHARSLEAFGGAAGPANPAGCVDGALGAAFSAELYLEGKRHLKAGLPFAAYCLSYLVRRHCFVDGNKRVAWGTAMDVLAGLGLGIRATDDEVVAFLTAVIAGEYDGPAIVGWFTPRLFALP